MTVSAASVPVTQASNILEPWDLGATVYPSEDGYIMSMALDDTTYWERTLNSDNLNSFIGSEWNNQIIKENDLDNVDYFVYPMGKNTAISTLGLIGNFQWDIQFDFNFSRNNLLTQGFSILIQPYILAYDADGTFIYSFSAESSTYSYSPDSSSFSCILIEDFPAASFHDAAYIAIFCRVEFNGLEDESIIGNVNFNTSSKYVIRIPVSDAYANNFLQGEIFDSIINPDSGGASQDFQDKVNDQSSTLESMGAVLDSMAKPNPGDINVSLDSYVSPDSMSHTSNVLTVLWSNDLFVSMLMALLTMGICAYALFGKR